MAYWQRIFPQNVITFFCRCNSVRIGQNIQKEVSLERYIFADVVAYQFIKLNWKLNGSSEECIHRSIWVVYDPSRRKRVNVLPTINNTELCWPNYTRSAYFSDGLVVINQRRLRRDDVNIDNACHIFSSTFPFLLNPRTYTQIHTPAWYKGEAADWRNPSPEFLIRCSI